MAISGRERVRGFKTKKRDRDTSDATVNSQAAPERNSSCSYDQNQQYNDDNQSYFRRMSTAISV